MDQMGAAKFKAECLAILDDLPPDGIIVTKHGKPVARVLPYPTEPADSIGALAGKLEVHGDILTTGVRWGGDA
jgi:antitoxin (DNA-binding transcriptional repressor) of toxin-antitoxin stability system